MRPVRRWLIPLTLVAAAGCASGGKPTVPTEPTRARATGWTERGLASWYGHPYHGRRTASGEVYDMDAMTAAHRSLPFGTVVRVTRRDTGASVKVRINDRGPFIKGRIIDLSRASAKRIGLFVDGVAPVKIEVLRKAEADPAPPPRADANPAEPACFWIQVGAFGDADNASRAVRRLKKAGIKALQIEGPEGLLRVRVGPFTDEAAARAALEDLSEAWPVSRLVECGG